MDQEKTIDSMMQRTKEVAREILLVDSGSDHTLRRLQAEALCEVSDLQETIRQIKKIKVTDGSR